MYSEASVALVGVQSGWGPNGVDFPEGRSWVGSLCDLEAPKDLDFHLGAP